MAAVRSGRVDASAPVLFLPLAIAAACAVLLLASAGLFLGTRPGGSPSLGATGPALAAADTALTVGDQLSRTAPAALVAPVQRELELINRDLESTRQLLLASLP